MAIAKLSIVVPVILLLLRSVAAAPISAPQEASSSSSLEQKRGYDGDWLYSRQDGKPTPPFSLVSCTTASLIGP